ncbi:MAG: MBL fold metallo-hydrolase [Planctomycetota bacterium]
MFSAPRYEGPPSDHFDGRRFHNVPESGHGSVSKLLRFLSSRAPGPWRREENAPGPPPPTRSEELRLTFVGHATCLVQVAGLNLLTDPVWSERCSPVGWAGPRRFRAPGLRLEDLPPLDAVLLSHNHYDHLDLPTLRALHTTHGAPVLAPLGNAALLAQHGVAGEDLDWWEERALGPLRAVCTPARHFSGRGPNDRDATLWSGWSLLRGDRHELFFAGDTAHGEHFAAVRARLGAPRLALLPIGAYLPRWFMGPVHMDPAEAVQAHLELEAEQSVGIHFGTFALADDAMDQPQRELAAALEQAPLDPARFRTLREGEALELPARAAAGGPGRASA